MGELALTGLDDEMLARLSSPAQEHGRTAEAEAAAITAGQLRTSATSQDIWEAFAESRLGTGRLDVNTTDTIREDRDRGYSSSCD